MTNGTRSVAPAAAPTVAVTCGVPFSRLAEQAGPYAVEERNRTLARLLAHHQLSPATLVGEGARVPHALSHEMLEHTAWLLGTEAVSLRAVGAWRMGDHGVGDYLNATCATLGDVLDTCTHHVSLLHDGIRLSLKEIGDETLLVSELDDDVQPHRWYPELTLAKVVAELRRCFGGPSVPGLVRAEFADGAPSYAREFFPAFGVPVWFGHDRDALVFTTRHLATALPTADPVLHGIVGKQAASLLPRARSRELIERVRAVAKEELERSLGDQRLVARRLGMSTATLRRHLEERHAVRYSELLEDLRREIAESGLTDPRLTIDEVSRRAGFSQTTAFYRAFRRWYHTTPAEFRRRAAVR